MDQSLGEDRFEEFAAIFGDQPPTFKANFKPSEDAPTVAVVFRELTRAQNIAVHQAVGACASEEEKEIAWTTESLVRSILSIGDRVLPDPSDVDLRRRIIGRWPDSTVANFADAYTDFWHRQRTLAQIVTLDPNPAGENIGPSFSPKEHGAASR